MYPGAGHQQNYPQSSFHGGVCQQPPGGVQYRTASPPVSTPHHSTYPPVQQQSQVAYDGQHQRHSVSYSSYAAPVPPPPTAFAPQGYQQHSRPASYPSLPPQPGHQNFPGSQPYVPTYQPQAHTPATPQQFNGVFSTPPNFPSYQLQASGAPKQFNGASSVSQNGSYLGAPAGYLGTANALSRPVTPVGGYLDPAASRYNTPSICDGSRPQSAVPNQQNRPPTSTQQQQGQPQQYVQNQPTHHPEPFTSPSVQSQVQVQSGQHQLSTQNGTQPITVPFQQPPQDSSATQHEASSPRIPSVVGGSGALAAISKISSGIWERVKQESIEREARRQQKPQEAQDIQKLREQQELEAAAARTEAREQAMMQQDTEADGDAALQEVMKQQQLLNMMNQRHEFQMQMIQAQYQMQSNAIAYSANFANMAYANSKSYI
ncbi:hypothetical protein BJ508DRAFT_410408 [Ascobolus immersus RN42]|uniref:Uncharacterized protein n=1 Tax=Ascobolus immersus RN42 TaxID=1160509 RepID=A0A3N4ITR9_ASCIM|nr:hypothetical protein BJ508DRAFT_410408 [Ascobolus immersus RN42]